VDRLSSVLGLDSPALSYGLSPASRGLNAPSLNAFRFLPFLQETFPDLLRYNSKHLEQFHPIAKPRQRQNDRPHNVVARPNPPRGFYQPRFEQAEVVTDGVVRSTVTNSTSFKGARPPAISVATSDLRTSGNASGTSAGPSSTSTTFSTVSQKFPPWPEPNPANVADLFDWDMDVPRPSSSSSTSRLPHPHPTNYEHEQSTCAGSVGSLTSPISDLGSHHLGMEDESDENAAAPMLSYEQKDDRVWHWLSSRAISPVYLDTAAGEDPDAFSGESWLPQGGTPDNRQTVSGHSS